MLKKWRFGECGVKKAGFFISQFKLHQLTHTHTVNPTHPTTSLYISENDLCWSSILAFFFLVGCSIYSGKIFVYGGMVKCVCYFCLNLAFYFLGSGFLEKGLSFFLQNSQYSTSWLCPFLNLLGFRSNSWTSGVCLYLLVLCIVFFGDLYVSLCVCVFVGGCEWENNWGCYVILKGSLLCWPNYQGFLIIVTLLKVKK